MATHDFLELAFPRSVRSVLDLDVRLVRSMLQVSFKAYQGFVPNCFEGASIVLETVTDQGPKSLRGHLRSIPVSAPRGVWYRYEFEPEKAHEIFWILDWDTLWTNVKNVSITTSGGSYASPNPFFRAPAAVAV